MWFSGVVGAWERYCLEQYLRENRQRGLDVVLDVGELGWLSGIETPVGKVEQRQTDGGCKGVYLNGLDSARELRPRVLFGRELEGVGIVF